MRHFKFARSLPLVIAAATSCTAQADVRYRLRQIVADSPAAQLEARELNDRGELSGFVADAKTRAFLWNGRFIDLGPRIDPANTGALATGNNDHSDITGSFNDAAGTRHGFLLLRGRTRALVEVFPGNPLSVADVNNRRQVAGVASDPSGRAHGFVWQRGEATLFEPLPVHAGRLAVAQINGHGVVVGTSGRQLDEFDSEQAVIWQDGAPLPIAPATFGPDFEPANSQGIAINDRGQAIGMLSGRDSGGGYSFVWRNGTLTELPSLAGGSSPATQVRDINNVGVIVGGDGSGSSLVATLWRGGAIVDLNTRIAEHDPLQPFVTLRVALTINDRGEIVALGHDARAPESVLALYVLRPTLH